MFTAALFPIAKTQKQPKYHSMDAKVKENVEYMQWNIIQPLKEGNSVICNNVMDLEGIILSEIKQSDTT